MTLIETPVRPVMDFHTALLEEILTHMYAVQTDNIDFDHPSFKQLKPRFWVRFKNRLKCFLRQWNLFVLEEDFKTDIRRFNILKEHAERFATIHRLFSDERSQQLFVMLMTYRILGHYRMKLPQNNKTYWALRERCRQLAHKTNKLPIEYKNLQLPFFDLSDQGFPIRLYHKPSGVCTTFLLRHYDYQHSRPMIQAGEGDIVIDAGGCWGDTALYFAHAVGLSGKVFTFEFVPSNLAVLAKNLTINPELQERITIVQQALSDQSGDMLYCVDRGPGSQVSAQKSSELDLEVQTLSIDDFVVQHQLPRVDFIKMDIEGAELAALKGAENTIRQHRPKLAVSLYHRSMDYIEIPEYLYAIMPDYAFFLDHFTIHRLETVLFCIPQKEVKHSQ